MRAMDVPAGRPVEELKRAWTSPALLFLVRLLTLAVTSFVWFLILIASAVVVLLYLIAGALARGANAMLSAFLSAEAAASEDVSRAFARLLGRRTESEDVFRLAPRRLVALSRLRTDRSKTVGLASRQPR